MNGYSFFVSTET